MFRKGSKVRVDAHYEAVEMNIRRSVLEQGIYIYCKTPFGTVGEMYYPQKGADDANLNRYLFEQAVSAVSVRAVIHFRQRRKKVKNGLKTNEGKGIR